MSADITAIILTFNEEKHIKRCIQNLQEIASRIIVVDSLSTDNTVVIAKENGAEVVEHAWPGNQAEQFNWTLDNIKINTEWIIRLDADEYLTKKLKSEIKNKLPLLSPEVKGISMSRAIIFMGHLKKHGVGSNVSIVRLFRKGSSHYEHRIMDEHLLVKGLIIKFQNIFIDDNLNGIDFFITKHLQYASREAALQLAQKYNLYLEEQKNLRNTGIDIKHIRTEKHLYTKTPLFIRCFLYFVYRYFFKLGVLDGLSGFLFDFFQGWWYRSLVDMKIWNAEKACAHNKEKIQNYIKEELHVKL